MGKLSLRALKIAGAFEVVSHAFKDERGAFSRLYCAEELREVLGGRTIAQVNASATMQVGAMRGLHYQKAPSLEMKLVRCLKGRVFDVVVDLRQGSDTFLLWDAIELSPDKANMMVVPEGCAHGFQVLEQGSELLYMHTALYEPASEGGLSFDDPKVGIDWPLAVRDLSVRDQGHPMLSDDFTGLKV
ncbi:MAG: dTDP-4-keto-6-deoxy-D-glucose epimerase [Alphaproteobacteria bacterium]|nr:MAG: dTDP-4-keto-6-deoxy-D-glucose epimerase [Alphaproteobacteria bacterium]